jgi:hypothetical protein
MTCDFRAKEFGVGEVIGGVLIAALTSEAKNNAEQAPRRRRLKRASGNDSCVLADSGFPFAGQLNNETCGLLDVHRGIVH